MIANTLVNRKNERVASKHLTAFILLVFLFSLLNLRTNTQDAFASIPQIQLTSDNECVFNASTSSEEISNFQKDSQLETASKASIYSAVSKLKPDGKKVSIIAGQGIIVGNLHGPKYSSNQELYPLVLVLHGLGDNRTGINGYHRKMATKLARNGMVVLRIDFRGHGESSGSHLDVSAKTLVEDTNCALNYLKSVKNGDQSQISIVGLSLGGTVGALVAANRSDVKNLVVQESPFHVVSTLGKLHGVDSVNETLKGNKYWLKTGNVKLSTKCLRQFMALDMVHQMSKFTGNVLLINGGQDDIVHPINSNKWQKSLVNANTEKVLFEFAGHAFLNSNSAKSAISVSVDWLGKHVNKQAV